MRKNIAEKNKGVIKMARKTTSNASTVKKESEKAKKTNEAAQGTSASTSDTIESNTVQENAQSQNIFVATVALPPQYNALNIREEPNGKIVGTLKDGAQVTHYGEIKLDNGETWVQISGKQFVNATFLKTK